MKQLIVIDCQYDFIEGSLATHKGVEAVETIVQFLHDHPAMEVFYSLDWHRPTNKSFKVNGGIWPIHCVQNERGSELDIIFDGLNDRQRPQASNRYYKGEDDETEEYSAFYAKNKENQVLNEKVDDHVMIAGIASEYCVLETIKELRNAGKKVTVLRDGLGYVDPVDHERVLKEYETLGVEWR